MAVYTPVSDEDVRAFLAAYDLPPFAALKGIAEGTENSNYLLLTAEAPYILTLYEKRVNPADLPFFLALMDHLARAGIPCPRPVPGRDGLALRALCGRPAALSTFLNGASVRRIQPAHCADVGRQLAHMHRAAETFSGTRPNTLTLPDWDRLLHTACAPDDFRPGLGAELDRELDELRRLWPQDLPCGVIHADLFPDNVFFLDGRLSGVIDFYFACTDFFAYELAICLNAWCFEEDHVAFNVTKARHLLAGYQSARPLSSQERDALPCLCQGAALRFLLTRLADWHTKPPEVRRNPEDYLTRLRFHQQIARVSEYGLEDTP